MPRIRRIPFFLLLAVAAAALASLAPRDAALAAHNSVFIGDVTVTEGDTGTNQVLVPVTYSVPVLALSVTVSIQLANANGADIALVTTSLSLHGSGTKNVTLSVFGDLDREPAQQATITLTPGIGGASGDLTGFLTVLDNDHPSVTISNATVTEGTATTIVHTVTLAKAINQPTAFSFTTTAITVNNGIDVQLPNGAFTILANTNTRTLTFNLVAEPTPTLDLSANETYRVDITPTVPSDIGPGSDLVGIGTIVDDEAQFFAPFLAIFQRAGDPIPPSGQIQQGCQNTLDLNEPAFSAFQDLGVRVTIDVPSPVAFEFLLSVVGANGPNATLGTDYTVSQGHKIFPASTKQFSFNVRVFGEGGIEGDEFFGLLATGGQIANAQACNQNLNGANATFKITANIL